MITGRSPGKLRMAVKTPSRQGEAWGIAAELTDRAQVPGVRKQLAAERADARLPVNGAGFSPRMRSLNMTKPSTTRSTNLNRAVVFTTRTVVAGMLAEGTGGAIVNIGALWAHQGIAATPTLRVLCPGPDRHRGREVANMVSFLLSDKRSWMIGAIVDVDGGVMAGRN
ncbi:SDR family oxidoreductase [Amycolatopsis sp. FDAARGOS 1241]|uniref:SDR family oxidoreductase n=1 Tax=Amycolatopsis sp. FDAARGOS 1241 TaxID=2778070 RepID=UPI001EF213E1|nr:SDR family oxidoreductase [Amycolatopsis sp. FDAARGOS 1241]